MKRIKGIVNFRLLKGLNLFSELREFFNFIENGSCSRKGIEIDK